MTTISVKTISNIKVLENKEDLHNFIKFSRTYPFLENKNNDLSKCTDFNHNFYLAEEITYKNGNQVSVFDGFAGVLGPLEDDSIILFVDNEFSLEFSLLKVIKIDDKAYEIYSVFKNTALQLNDFLLNYKPLLPYSASLTI